MTKDNVLFHTVISFVIASLLTCYSSTYLFVMQTRFAYPVGIISIIALGFLFWQQNLLGSTALQIYLMPWMLWGWFRWGPDLSTRPVSHVGKDWVTYLTFGMALPVLASIMWLSWKLDGNYVLLDSIIFTLSV